MKDKLKSFVLPVLLSMAFGIQANASCQAGFTFTLNGTTATFTDVSTFTSPMNYYWTFYTDPSHSQAVYSSSNTPAPVNFLYAGSYIVTLHIADTLPSTCSSNFTDTVVITSGPHPPCNANFNYFVDTMANYPVHFGDVQPNYIVKWVWNFGDGNYDSTSGNNVTHQYSLADTFLVTLTSTTSAGDTCHQTNSVIAISCAQLLNTSYSSSANLNTISFTSNCSGANIPTYYWNFGDGYYSSLQNPVHTYQYNGTYSACLTYGDSLTCHETFCNPITITNGSPFPCNAIFSYHPDTSGAYTISYNDISTLNIASRVWNFQQGTPSSSTNPNEYVSYPGPGKYFTSLTVTNQSGITCYYSDSVTVGNNCLNTNAYFTLAPDTAPQVWQINNMSTGTPAITYSWDWVDSSPISTGAAPNHTYTTAGWYTICLNIVDASGCGSSYCTHDSVYRSMAMISVYVINTGTSTGVHDASLLEINFNIYPNPVTDHTSIKYELDQTTNVELGLYDIAGRKIIELESGIQKSGTHQFNFDTQQIPVGIYMLRLAAGERTVTKKLVIIK